MQRFFLFFLVFLIFSCQKQEVQQHPLSVSENGHFLLKNNKSFFWLGDTAWELFHRLDREEAEKYIQIRAKQGFNVIQSVVLPELDAFTLPNAYGDFPLIDADISKLNTTEGDSPDNEKEYDYFDHVEWIISKAHSNKMMVGVLPCWGEYVTPRKRECTISTIEDGYNYGWFIGNRFKHLNNNIIWILGGDRLPDEKDNGVEVWRSMAEGITDAVNGEKAFNREANYESTFMTYHCYQSSSRWFHNDNWIDFHTWGSYHAKRDNERAYSVAGVDWNLENNIPTLDSEPAYENIPVNYKWKNAENGYFDDFDVRQHAYWSVFSGSCGHTYGAHPVWQMNKENLSNEMLAPTTKDTWADALNYTGGNQMVHLKNLMLSRPFTDRIPAQHLLVENSKIPAEHIVATSGADYAMVYVPRGAEVHINPASINGDELRAWWFNPQTGKALEIETFKKAGNERFNVPGETCRGNDWVLVIDNVEKNFNPPGE